MLVCFYFYIILSQRLFVLFMHTLATQWMSAVSERDNSDVV